MTPMKKQAIFLSLFLIGAFVPNVSAQTEIGLQLYSLRNEFKKEVPGTLNLIKRWGIRKIEGGGTYGLPMESYKKNAKG